MSIPTISLNAETAVLAAHSNHLSAEDSRLAVKELRRLRAENKKLRETRRWRLACLDGPVVDVGATCDTCGCRCGFGDVCPGPAPEGYEYRLTLMPVGLRVPAGAGAVREE